MNGVREIKFHSQPATSQDRWVVDQLQGKRGGVFVEVGAHDGVRHSNTLTLEQEYDWNGVLIEPNAELFKQLKVNRPNCTHVCKVVDRERGVKNFVTGIGNSNAFSGIVEHMSPEWLEEHRLRKSPVDLVQTYGLNELLYQARCPYHVDYLSIDVEGAELPILEGVLRSPLWRFQLITVEFRYDTLLLEKLEAMLEHLYILDEVRAFDACFVHREFS